MPPAASTPADLLAAALRDAPAAPLLTWYDDPAGERVELSAATLANWVAKTANLLQDEFDVGRGSRVAVLLPPHWQTAAVLLGVWSCGGSVVSTAGEDVGALADVDVVLVSQDRLEAVTDALGEGAGDGTPELVGLSLHPLGAGMAGYVGPARDFALEVRTHGDHFSPYDAPEPGSPGLAAGGLELSLGSLVAAAQELAGRCALAAGDRVLVDGAAAEEAGPVAWLLMPLAAGASVVLCRDPRPERLAGRAQEERVTASLGVRIDGVRVLGAA
ncbi:TIGR03089 family protein [Blastococcus litoris]|uniref:TIGR03089 family protein n=1 Tax=Blastococcus litoris TaxID=2171622 RepID=UPI000E306409|nr:TIGR03089 family protein [Blastococcus litoris]